MMENRYPCEVAVSEKEKGMWFGIQNTKFPTHMILPCIEWAIGHWSFVICSLKRDYNASVGRVPSIRQFLNYAEYINAAYTEYTRIEEELETPKLSLKESVALEWAEYYAEQAAQAAQNAETPLCT